MGILSTKSGILLWSKFITSMSDINGSGLASIDRDVFPAGAGKPTWSDLFAPSRF